MSCVALAAIAAGCGAPAGGAGSTGDTQQAIATEHAGGVAQMAPRLYTSPDVTLSGYAVPDVGGCTGEMIGPNFMMTAAHCGDGDHWATFYTYRNQDPKQPQTEAFYCHMLLNTFWRTDMTLSFCDPNGAGENPGDKYGYLDFDHSQPTVGQAVYSYWYNPVDSLGVGWGEIYSLGKVTDTAAVIWGPAGSDGPMNEPVGIGTDLWTQPGASGSAILNPTNFRILVAPTSTGYNDAAGRWAQSAKTEFEQASVIGWDDGSTPPKHYTGVHDANIAALGLVGASYAGKLDKNGDYLFDIQLDAERRRGENARDWYYLGFESERRNALWYTDGSVGFDTYDRWAHIAVPTTATRRQVMVHTGLPLEASTSYRVSVMIATAAASSGASLHLAFMQSGLEEAGVDVPTAAGAGWQLVTFDLKTVSAHPQLALLVNGTLDANLTALSVVKDGAVMDFDSGDKRFSWRNDNTGGRGLILPDGNSTATTPNWAGYAVPTPGRAAGTDWPLRNRQLALVNGDWYELCADVRSNTITPGSDVANRVVRVLSAGVEVSRTSFRPSTSWTTVCSTPFKATSGDNNVQIGFDGPSATVGFYVDNLRLTRHACVPNPDPCGGASCGSASDGCGTTVACGVCPRLLACIDGECTCAPKKCAKGSWWNPDDCRCEIGLPR
ncbi:MAG: hypothetical protein ACXVCV_13545 [Polyangia bacterium]